MQALAYHQKGELALAQVGYEQVLASQPNQFDALHMLGVLATQTAQAEKAVALIQKALSIRSDVAGAHENLALALRQLHRFDEALAHYNQALQLEPNQATTYVNRGVVLRALLRHLEAIESYNFALHLRADLTQAIYNRGLAYNDLNLLPQAITDFDDTLTRQPSFHPAQWAKALCLLQMGDFKAGWPMYACRWQQDEKEFTSLALQTSVPRWQTGVHVKRLLVWAEQGVGDELMFGGLLPQAQQMCDELLVQIDERLVAMFHRAMPNVRFEPKHARLDVHSYDAHLALGDLPGIFCQRLEDFQSIQPAYVQADPLRVQTLRALLAPEGQRLCGLSWRSKNIKRGQDRSVPLKDLLLALTHQGVRLVNLQYGDVDEELIQAQGQTGIEVLQCTQVDNQQDLDGLAALIQACDLVVSADNSTVHLAGALGQTVWALLPFNADWRWLMHRQDSPWYPSARLFRQPTLGDWPSVLAELSNAFQQRVYV